MAIDFRCQGCNRLLRTDDADAGKPARCPECGQVTTVPVAAEAVDTGGSGGAAGDRVEGSRAAGGGANPYNSPATPAGPAVAATSAAGRPPLDVGDILSAAWRLYMDNIGICLGASVALVVLSLVVVAVVALLVIGATVLFVETMGDEGVVLAILVMIPLALALAAFGIWLQAGFVIVLLKIARGEDDVAFGDLFSGGQYVLPLLGSSLLLSVMVFAGTLACIVPGVILQLMFLFYFYAVVDRGQGALESLGTSRRLTQGNLLNVFLLWMLVFGISLVAGMIPCGIGQIMALPLVALIWVIAYLRLTGQPTAERRPQPVPMPAPGAPKGFPGAPPPGMAPTQPGAPLAGTPPQPPRAPQPGPPQAGPQSPRDGDSPFGT